ncbi:BRO-N domain-containing protein [Xenorhabdus bovienii]|uniref:BRO-N domain-containing protein n=1 Tax=Xenorhabdus bovienii TaxID=40576 RepID=UPI0004D3BDDF|nr:BRO family protein [Xenorhabdus bovienii]CDG88428.1 putative phage anti-repressor protein [Xenorhabdus bovienii str. feltiae France]CDG93861.1 putative phage anti-repressor protein [Xenorhabdus bovienii str. feltiae Florida]
MAKNTLMIFSNEELDIELQGMLYNGKPVFIAVEIAKALGYERPHDALSAHCKSLIKIKYGEMASLGFEPKPNGMSLLTEPDLYRLILRSKLSSAERVQDWVCEEVLPAIRQTGGYQIQPQLSADYFLNNPEVTIALISGQANKILALSHTVETVTVERDEAVRTKSQISQKREAVALQRNSALQRKLNRATRERDELAAQFGASKEWASTQQVWRATATRHYYRPLMRWCDDHDLQDTYCFDPITNDYVLSFPHAAWLEVYGVDIAKLF